MTARKWPGVSPHWGHSLMPQALDGAGWGLQGVSGHDRALVLWGVNGQLSPLSHCPPWRCLRGCSVSGPLLWLQGPLPVARGFDSQMLILCLGSQRNCTCLCLIIGHWMHFDWTQFLHVWGHIILITEVVLCITEC